MMRVKRARRGHANGGDVAIFRPDCLDGLHEAVIDTGFQSLRTDPLMFGWDDAIGFIRGGTDMRAANIDSDDEAHARHYNRGGAADDGRCG